MWSLAALVLLAVVFALLFVPADVTLEIEHEETFTAWMGFHWLFVHVRRQLKTGGRREKARKERPHRKSSGSPLRSLTAIGRVPGLWAAIRRFIARMIRSVRVKEIGGDIRLGLGDPADTGELWALVWSLAAWSNRWRQVDLCVEPDFSRACLVGTVSGTVRFYPARFAYGICATFFSMTTVRLVFAVLRSRSWRH